MTPPDRRPGAIRRPGRTTWARPPRSARRTSHIDMAPVGRTGADGLVLAGGARDALTGTGGGDGSGAGFTVRAEASLRAEVGPERQLLSLDPLPPGADDLIGRRVGSGFRAALRDALPAEVSRQTALLLLLDDLPVATLISGYADLYTGMLPLAAGAAVLRSQADICAGWATDAILLRTIGQSGRMPVPVGPAAAALDGRGDPHGWHHVPPLPAGAMRRRRLLELSAAGEPGRPLRVRAMFRDTHVGPDGIERVLHEYRLSGAVDAVTGLLTACAAEPRVLPWPECPHAAASAGRLVGRPVPEVRDRVGRELRGTTSCTHLNDLLRSLGDLIPLARMLEVDLGE